MSRRPPRSTRTDTLLPYPTLFRSVALSPVACMSRAFLLKDGKPRSMPSAEAEGIASDHDFLWLHLDGRDESAIATIQSDEGIPAIARSALLAHETRPRCAVLNGGALINQIGRAHV